MFYRRKKISTWKPKSKFLHKNKCDTTIAFLGHKLQINWSFQRLTQEALKCHVIQCSLKALGKEVQGYGSSIFLKKATTIALAEAWERLIFHLYRESSPERSQLFKSTTGFAAGRTSQEAKRFAREEFCERLLLYYAAFETKNLEKVHVEGIANSVLFEYLNRLSNLSLYRFRKAPWGDLLIGWLDLPGKKVYDSVFVSPKDFKCKLSKLLLSLYSSLAANPLEKSVKRINSKSPQIFLKPSELQTELLYPGFDLAPVALCYYNDASNHNLNHFRQDDLFEKLFSNICESFKT